MKKIKQIFTSFPESYFITLLLLAAYKPPFTSSAILLTVAGIVILQMFVLNRFLGMILANVFLILNLFILVALISELSEYKVFDRYAYQLLIGGLFIWCINLFFAILMIRKYLDDGKTTLVQ